MRRGVFAGAGAQERKRSRADWRRTWRSVPIEQQRNVREALRRGGAVDDPALAALAAEAAERRMRRGEGFGHPQLQWVVGSAQALVAAGLLVSSVANDDPLGVAFAAVVIVLAAGHVVLRRVARRRLERAAAANRALAGQPRYSGDTT
jgi:hypothetical protein